MSSSKTRSDKDYTEEETDRRYAKALKGAFTTQAPPLTPKAKKPVNPKLRKLEPKRPAKARRAKAS